MVNPGIVIFSIVILITLFVMIGFITWALVSQSQQNRLSPPGPTGPSGPSGSTGGLPLCNTIPDDLLIIPSDQPSCLQNGQSTPYYFIGNLGDQSLDYVVSPWGTQPNDVCVGFCSSLVDGVCTGPIYNGRTAQDNYTRCLAELSSTTCIPPKPLALKDNRLYYAFSPTCRVCDGCQARIQETSEITEPLNIIPFSRNTNPPTTNRNITSQNIRDKYSPSPEILHLTSQDIISHDIKDRIIKRNNPR